MNKRYGSDVSQSAINETLTRPHPISLSKWEVGAENVPDVPEPIDVEAWVRYPETAVRVDARAVAWTERAVLIEFTTHSRATHRAWVWAGAVQRRQGRKRPQ